MEIVIMVTLFVVFMLLIAANAIYSKQKTITILTIEFLNRELNDDNRDTYMLKRSFEYANFEPSGFPILLEENMVNYYYREALTEFESKKKMVRIMNSIFIPVFILLAIVLVINYPEFINELMKNDGP
jgi:hypothetical protein